MSVSPQALIGSSNGYSNNDNFNSIQEYSIPKVSFDGESHEIMTMIAAFSGLIAAVIVLIILIMLIGCGNNSDNHNEQQSSLSPSSSIPSSSTTSSLEQNSNNKKILKNKMTIIPIFDNNQKSINHNESELLSSVSIIKNHNYHKQQQNELKGYDNPVCENEPPSSSSSETKEELILKAISLPGIKTIQC